MNDRLSFQTTVCLVAFLLTACGSADPVDPQRYVDSDAIAQTMIDNLSRSNTLRKVADIDHSRLGHEAGSPMPPARVLIFSDARMEARLIQSNPLVALDLPLRVLTFEQGAGGPAKVIYNSFDYLVSRYQLDPGQTSTLRKAYENGFAKVTQGLPAEAITSFSRDEMQPDGIVTIESPYGFAETLMRVSTAIEAQNDAKYFGRVNFQADAAKQGIDIPPSHMILFGAPGPGGKAMADAPTLGLDGFCQKLLVWQAGDGRTFLSFNDLLALAERQETNKTIALRIINFRLNKTFMDALSED